MNYIDGLFISFYPLLKSEANLQPFQKVDLVIPFEHYNIKRFKKIERYIINGIPTNYDDNNSFSNRGIQFVI